VRSSPDHHYLEGRFASPNGLAELCLVLEVHRRLM
jgi:hypothetical protein